MNTKLRLDAESIIETSIKAVMPEKAVYQAPQEFQGNGGKIILIVIGKAPW